MLRARVLSTILVFAPMLASQAAVADAILNARFTPTEQEVFGHVRFLASDELAGRASGSAEGAVAGAYVAAEFSKLALEPGGKGGGFMQPFDRVDAVRATSSGPDGEPVYEAHKVVCRNVLGWVRGADADLAAEFVVVGAHYDHLGTRGDTVFHGADDNASGVAGMLAVARAVVRGELRPRRSVLFVAFDAEERGLAGSELFARDPPRSLQQCVAMINLDMIGRARLLDRREMALAKRVVGIPDAPAVGVLGTAQSPELAGIARAVFRAAELPLFAPEDFGMLGAVIEKQAAGRSDHAPFERRGIPFLFFSTSENDDYHQPTDTIDKVDPAALWQASRCVYRTLLAIDGLAERPAFVPRDGAEGGAGKDR